MKKPADLVLQLFVLLLAAQIAAPLCAAESPLLVPLMAPAPEPPCSTQALFVDPSGSNDNDGRSAEKPVKSIQQAANLAQPGDTIYIRKGVYREAVRPPRSGAEGAPITFTSYPGERAQINGADLLSASWSKASSDPYYTTSVHGRYVSPHGFSQQVFCDGQMLTLARWPNTGDDLSRPAKSAITAFVSKNRNKATNLTTGIIEDKALAQQRATVAGAEIVFQPNAEAWSWAFSGRVLEQQGIKLTFVSTNDSGKDGGTGYPVGSRYFLFNALSLLDAPGEWFLDAQTQQLSLIPPQGDDPSRHAIEIKRRDWAFDLTERSHIVIRDLDLFACSITTDVRAGGDGIPYHADGQARYPWRGKRDGIAPASDILLQGIKADYLTHFTDISGHFIQQWGQGTGIVLSGSRMTLQDSVLRFSAGNGVTALGRGHKVLNNLIVDTDYAGVECAGINTGGAAITQDHELAYNTIARCGRSGITPRNLANSDPTKLVTRIHHNDIFHCMLQDWDGGGVYVAVVDAKFVRVDHNLMHDMEGFNTSGIYPDFSKNYVFDHNVIWNIEWGMQFQGAYGADGRTSEEEAQNNTLAYNNTIYVTSMSGAPYGPFGFAGSKGKNIGTVIENNIIAISKKTPGWKPFASAYEKADIQDNLIWEGVGRDANDPKFADPAAGLFTLQANSPAGNKARALSAVERDGITVPPFAEGTPPNPNLGAYPDSTNPWQAGCSLRARQELAPWGSVKNNGKLR